MATREDQQEDLAQLMSPIDTSAQGGVSRLLAAFQGGSDELQHLLTAECSVILECNRCRSLFRSLANLVAHKRTYCRSPEQNPLETLRRGHTRSNQVFTNYCHLQSINNELSQRGLNGIVDRLAERASRTCNDGVRIEDPDGFARRDYMSSVANTVLQQQQRPVQEIVVSLTSLPGSSAAVHQSLSAKPSSDNTSSPSSSHKSLSPVQIRKHRGRPRKSSVDQRPEPPLSGSVSGSEETAPGPTEAEKAAPDYCCEKCHARFSSQRCLASHASTQHHASRVQYKCPCCQSRFCNLWSTYRHLKKVHGKTQEYVQRMKTSIRNKAFKTTVPAQKSSSSPSPAPAVNSRDASPASVAKKSKVKADVEIPPAKVWNPLDNNFTVDIGDHRCGICGLSFERRAALVSHTNTCHRKPNPAQRSTSLLRPSTFPAPSPEVPFVERAAIRKGAAPFRLLRKMPDTVEDESEAEKRKEDPTNSSSVQPPTVEPKSPVKLNGAALPVVTLLPHASIADVVKTVIRSPGAPLPSYTKTRPNIIKRSSFIPKKSPSPVVKPQSPVKTPLIDEARLIKVTRRLMDVPEIPKSKMENGDEPQLIRLAPVTGGAPRVINVSNMIQTLKTPTFHRLVPPSEEPQKAEILLRTVSDKPAVPPPPLNNNNTNSAPVVKLASSISLGRNWFAAGSADKRWEQDAARSVIQIRKDYTKMMPKNDGEGASEDEVDFAGWGEDVSFDDMRSHLGLPSNVTQLPTMDALDVSDSSPSSSCSSDEDEEIISISPPSSPECVTEESPPEES